ncbi:DUF3343 domain-containing protein [Proteiniborus sp. MB09-C3]|uniref:DUF3343 domain-containing protein n=1 Tax=Proteiniborus sp. MB09-C3 TaxID=3050072 RepID=UPI002557C3F7|nr:DUF3343 domain-containing protein [Proteiniborus sp. MB09-C3]WIV11198.1 DUF3343 domain-containing protein [Proteiniborus sp. MB09-C3]
MDIKSISGSKYYIAVFKSKNYAVQLYYKLEKAGYSMFQLISTPCHISGGCSYSIKFSRLSDLNYFKNYSSDFEKEIYGVYHVEKRNGTKVYDAISLKNSI